MGKVLRRAAGTRGASYAHYKSLEFYSPEEEASQPPQEVEKLLLGALYKLRPEV